MTLFMYQEITWSKSDVYLFSTQVYPSHDGGHYHIETSPLICSANQWTGFYMITASVMKGLRVLALITLVWLGHVTWRNGTFSHQF